ncbi:MAG TPA: hypothetical protein VKN74_07350 [Candidatus Mcinerneyibacterium sp.]|nr:hypothetical protein [Candidatus Mcinerneyibacterium sp.]
MKIKYNNKMNYAEKLVNEVSGEKKGWNAEEFMKTFYPELFNIPESKSGLSSNKKEKDSGKTSGSLFTNEKKIIPLLHSELPEVSFKFNYKNKQKDPLEELGIEVLK